MKILRPLIMLLLVLAVTSVAVAQAPQPAIGPSLINIPALKAILCPAGSCGDHWGFYLPTQAANGVNPVFTAPLAARPGGVKVYVDGIRMYQVGELPGGFSAQISVTVAAGSPGVTTVTFNPQNIVGGFVPGFADNVLIEATL